MMNLPKDALYIRKMFIVIWAGLVLKIIILSSISISSIFLFQNNKLCDTLCLFVCDLCNIPLRCKDAAHGWQVEHWAGEIGGWEGGGKRSPILLLLLQLLLTLLLLPLQLLLLPCSPTFFVRHMHIFRNGNSVTSYFSHLHCIVLLDMRCVWMCKET